MSRTFTIQDLVRETGLSDRTIKFYIAEGLLEGPTSPGRYATYGQRHLDRLTWIADLAAQGLKLSAIKLRLQDEESAASYVRRALQEMNLPPTFEEAAIVTAAQPVAAEPEIQQARPTGESWRHFALTEGVELHCRQPLPDDLRHVVEQTIAFFQAQREALKESRG